MWKIGSMVVVAGALGAGTLLAAEPEPVGIGACDTFLAAYAQCAASPSVPADAKAAIKSGIESLRTTFRSATSQSATARDTIRQQCVSSHELVRQRMIDAFKCDFPAASAMPAVADAPFVAPAPVAKPAVVADPAVEVTRKVNAYTEVQNNIVDRHPMGHDLAEHIRNNERVLKLGTKLGANAWYLFGIGDFDNTIKELKEAIAMPGSVPEVDPKAAALLVSLEAVNPTIKELARYQTMRDFKEDGFKLAREREKPLEDGMRAALVASKEFSDSLFDRRMALDEKRVAGMQTGSLARGLLATSLKTRMLLRSYDAMDKPADVPAFLSALTEVRAANTGLMDTAKGLSPAVASECADYSGKLDDLIGHGKDLADQIKGKHDAEVANRSFVGDYNKSIEIYARCLKSEARARS